MCDSDENLKLAEFRTQVASFYPECDEKLLTWLRARELNVDKAVKMLRRHLIWRKNNEIDSLKYWQPPKYFYPYLHSGFGFQNHPVFILPVGRWDIRGVIEAGDMVPGTKYVYQCLDLIQLMTNKTKVYKSILIFDFDGFAYRQIAHRTVVQGMLEVLKVVESNMPESIYTSIVINAPKLFHVIFKMIQPLLNSTTLAKVQIFGPDREKWQECLFEYVAKDQLPPYWGGTLAGTDEYCSNLWFGEPLPPYFMRKLATYYDEFGEDWFTVKVEPREQFKLNYLVETNEQQQCTLKWSFTTEGCDIGFSIYRDENNEFIVPYKIMDSHLNQVNGSLRLEQAGKYTIIFDNSYSRRRAKMLNCSITMLKENSEKINPQIVVRDQFELMFKSFLENNCKRISHDGD